jgi:hypothetical protein
VGEGLLGGSIVQPEDWSCGLCSSLLLFLCLLPCLVGGFLCIQVNLGCNRPWFLGCSLLGQGREASHAKQVPTKMLCLGDILAARSLGFLPTPQKALETVARGSIRVWQQQ